LVISVGSKVKDTVTHLRLLLATEVIEDSSDRLTFGISYGSESIPCHRTQHESREISDDEPNASTTDRTQPRPPVRLSLDFWFQKLNHQVIKRRLKNSLQK
jgi:hypothetical protein